MYFSFFSFGRCSRAAFWVASFLSASPSSVISRWWLEKKNYNGFFLSKLELYRQNQNLCFMTGGASAPILASTRLGR